MLDSCGGGRCGCQRRGVGLMVDVGMDLVGVVWKVESRRDRKKVFISEIQNWPYD